MPTGQAQLLTSGETIELAEPINADLLQFLEHAAKDNTIDPTLLDVPVFAGRWNELCLPASLSE